MPAADRRGFTLIELIAGLALAGVVFVSMLLLIDQLRDGRDRLLDQARRDNKRANGQRLLRTLIARAEATADTAKRFTGGMLGAAFVSWCEVPGGWLERCAVAVFTERTADSTYVRALLSTGERLDLIATDSPVEFRYFDAASNEPRWVTAWGTSTALPAAVGIVTQRDTVIVRAGGRG